MDCPDDEALLRLINANGDLSTEVSRSLENHLSRCESCRHRIEAIAVTPSAVDLLREYSAWNSMASGLQSVIDQSSKIDLLQTGEADSSRWLTEAELVEILDSSEAPGVLGLLGDMEVLELLGQGGMGIVVRARDPGLDREVAAKLLKPSLSDRPELVQLFKDEARAVAAMAHEHILPIHQVADHHGLPYFVMPLVTGATLAGRLRVEGAASFTETLGIALRLSQALEAAHNAGIVHGDLKPANVLFGGAAVPTAMWLADFGLGRRLKTESEPESGATEKSGAGTPGYVAPEVVSGGRPGVRSDLYGLGKVFAAMIERSNEPAPQWFQSLIKRMTAAKVEDRPESVGSVITELERGTDALAARGWLNKLGKKILRVCGIAAFLVATAILVAFVSDAFFGTAWVNRGISLISGRNFSIAGHLGVFENLADAVESARDGETILIAGNGPYFTPPIIIQGKSVTIRAGGKNNRPVIQSLPLVADSILWMQYGNLKLEGIDFRKELDSKARLRHFEAVIQIAAGSLEMNNCRVSRNELPVARALALIRAEFETENVNLRNCDFVSPFGAGIQFSNYGLIERTVMNLENCRFQGASWIGCEAHEGTTGFERKFENSKLSISAMDCKFRGKAGFILDPKIEHRLTIDTKLERCLIQTDHTLIAMAGAKMLEPLRQSVSVKTVDSIFSNRSRYPIAFANGLDPKLFVGNGDLETTGAEWRRYWEIADQNESPQWKARIFSGKNGWELLEKPED